MYLCNSLIVVIEHFNIYPACAILDTEDCVCRVLCDLVQLHAVYLQRAKFNTQQYWIASGS
jgi:hypothetical protein